MERTLSKNHGNVGGPVHFHVSYPLQVGAQSVDLCAYLEHIGGDPVLEGPN
jgi:hypothetical protein